MTSHEMRYVRTDLVTNAWNKTDQFRNPLSAILQSADSIVSTLSGDAPILNESVTLSAEVAEDLIDAAQTIILCGECD